MKSNLPYNVMNNPNDWANVPRDPVTIAAAIAPSLFAGGAAIGFAGTLLTFGVSFAISAVTSWALSALAPKPTDSSRGLLTNLREATAPHEYVYGEVRKGGVVTYLESTGEKNKYLHQIIALAGHEVESIGDIYIDDEIVTVEGETPIYTISVNQTVVQGGEGGETFTETATYTLTIPSAYDIHTVGEALSEAEFDVLVANAISNTNNSSFGNITFNSATLTSKVANVGLVTGDRWKSKIRVQKYLGGQTTAPADLLAESELTGDNALDANFVGNGIAYLYVRYEYDQDVFANGLPLVTAVVKGKKVEDPRTSTTGYSANAALCIRDYLTSEYGMYDVGSTNDTAFSVAANVCDEDVDLAVTGVQPRYEMNGVISAASTPSDILQSMMTSCAGTLFWGQGKWQLRVGHYTPPVKTFTLDDLRGPINLSTRVSRRDNFNIVRGTFNNADDRFITQDYPQIKGNTFITEDNNLENVLDLALPLTTSSAMAQRIAKMTLFRGREQMTFSADFSMEAFNVQAGDIVALTNPRYGWVDKEFEVKDWKFFADDDAGDLRVNLTLQETSAAAFDWDAEETAIISNNTTLPVYNAGTDILGLTASGGGRLQGDGTFINSVFVAWTPAQNAYVSHYDVEWKAVVDGSYSSTITSEPTIELSPLIDGVEYVIRVRAVTVSGFRGSFSSVFFTGGGDVTAPSDPTSLSATGTLGFIDISWVNPADTDFNFVEVWESADSNIANATQIAKAFGDTFSRGNLSPLVTRYYWIRAVDFSGNKSGFVGPEFATTSQITAGDIGPAVIGYDNFATDVTTLFDDISTDLSQRVLVSDYNITVDYQQQLEAATEQLATDALTLALNASSLESRINDAGITVDPATGSVTIQGLSAVEDQVNEVKIDLDAVEGELTLKATTTYVNNAIAAATLPEASLAALEGLEARVGVVEVDLNSVEGSITLTSTGSYYNVNDSVLGVEALEGRITINEGQISLKASQTEMDDVETRLGSAEITLNSIDVPSISLAVQDVRSISEKQDDLATLNLQEVLGRYKDREYLLQDSAYARLSLTADVNDEREARAAAELELSAEIGANKALLLSEQVARADADSALAEDITQLEATVIDLDAGIVGNATAVSSLTTRVDNAEGTITAQSASITDLESELSTVDGLVSGNATAISGLTTRVGNAEGTITAQSASITDLESELSTVDGLVSGNATAISGLTTRVGNAEGTITAQASLITSLSTTVGDNTTSITEAATSINGIEAKYGIEIDNNGAITGYQLLSGVGGSAFNVRADQFAVFNADGSGGDNPFTIFTSSRTIDGVVYPAGTYIKDAFIDNATIINGSIVNAKIGNLAVGFEKIADLAVDTVKIQDQAVSNTGADSSGLTTVAGYTTIASVALSTGGGQTIVTTAGQFSFGGVGGEGSSYDGAWRILNGGTVLASGTLRGVASGLVDFAGLALTTSGAGTTTITLQCARSGSGDNTVQAKGTLVVTELKK